MYIIYIVIYYLFILIIKHLVTHILVHFLKPSDLPLSIYELRHIVGPYFI